MDRIVENYAEKVSEICDEKVLEKCDEKVSENCDEKVSENCDYVLFRKNYAEKVSEKLCWKSFGKLRLRFFWVLQNLPAPGNFCVPPVKIKKSFLKIQNQFNQFQTQ